MHSGNLIKAIHIFNDDKFIDTAIAIFEKIEPGSNLYLVIVPTGTAQFKYVKSELAKPLNLSSSQDFQTFKEGIIDNQINTVYLHALDKSKRKLIQYIPTTIVLVWFVWGYDLYNAWPVLQEKLYLKETESFLNKNRLFKNIVKGKLKKSYLSYRLFLYFSKGGKGGLYNKFYNILSNTHKEYYDAIKRINIVAPVVKEEMKWIDKMRVNIKYAPFAYAYLEQLLGEKYQDKENLEGINILVGNSATPTSNHVETFKKLSKLKLENRKVYVPLSYGGNIEYKNFVIEEGNKLLGKNFHPFTDFMPLEEYTKIISSCGILIFNHIRQQGVGNIIALGYLGSKIYLNKRSPVYRDFKKAGVHLFATDQLTQKSLNHSLKIFQINENKKFFEEEYSLSNVLIKVKKMHSTITEEIANRNDISTNSIF